MTAVDLATFPMFFWPMWLATVIVAAVAIAGEIRDWWRDRPRPCDCGLFPVFPESMGPYPYLGTAHSRALCVPLEEVLL